MSLFDGVRELSFFCLLFFPWAHHTHKKKTCLGVDSLLAWDCSASIVESILVVSLFRESGVRSLRLKEQREQQVDVRCEM